MLSNVLLIEVPWHQGGWDGTICVAPEENSAYCLPDKQKQLVSFCQAMAGLPHLDRSATTESSIRQGLGCLSGKELRTASPSLDCRILPDPVFGRRHLRSASWYPSATFSALPMLRPDPWCSPSLTVFKNRPSRHGLANLCTDDCFTLSRIDYQKLLDAFPGSWKNSSTDLGGNDNDRRLYCLICCKDHPLPMGDENAVVVVGALRVRWLRNEGNLWQFKGESGYRLPLQELLRFYDANRSNEDLRNELSGLLDELPTVDYFPGLFGAVTPKAAERILIEMGKSAVDLGKHVLATSPFSEDDANTFVTQFKNSPPFKYPNLGQVLLHVTKRKDALSQHMESYFNNTEDDLLAELRNNVDNHQNYSPEQKCFLIEFLIYYDIPASYLPAALALFSQNYCSHWGSYARIAQEFADKVLKQSPYHLAMGVTLLETLEKEGGDGGGKTEAKMAGKLTLDFRRIDEGERQRLGTVWQESDAVRRQALRYDGVLREEKGHDWAEVPREDGDEDHPLLEIVDDTQVQRRTLDKAHQLVAAFFADTQIATPADDTYALEDERKQALNKEVKKGFAKFYQSKFPEAEDEPDFEHFLTTDKGKQVLQAIGEQSSGLVEILTNRFTIITGKAGAGKSEMFKKVVQQLHEKETFLFMAPTGKAVQAIKEKIDEITDDQKEPVIPQEHYMTIQKFLVIAGATNELFEPAADKDPLKDWTKPESLQTKPVNIIIDEASMIDLEVMGNLCHTLQKLWAGAGKILRFVLVGDINQLPPVQSGYPFRQLLQDFEEKKNNGGSTFGFQRLDISLRFIMGETDELPLTKYADSFCSGAQPLEIEFPQEDGELLEVARNLYVGTFSDRQTLDACLDAVFALELPFIEKDGYQAVTWKTGETKTINDVLQQNLESLKELATLFDDEAKKEKEELSAIAGKTTAYFLDLLQFIIPTKKDYFGATQLTPRIRERYPQSKLVKYIQNRNDNKKEIFNGNLAAGIVSKINGKESTRLFYPDSRKDYLLVTDVPEATIDQAYAITVHKSQGSGFSINVAILPESIHEGLRSPQMQYTAVTRTKDICILLKERLGK